MPVHRPFKSLLKKSILEHADDDSMFNLDGEEYFSHSPEMFFRDGKRRIDFVLAYKRGVKDDVNESKRFAFLNALAEQMIEIEVEDCSGNILAATGPQNTTFKESGAEKLSHPANDMVTEEEIAAKTLERMEQGNLSALENDILAIDDLVFVKLHASWSTMARIGEVLQFRKPLKQNRVERLRVSPGTDCCKCLKPDRKDVLELPLPYRAPFSRGRMYIFEIPENYDDFWTPIERSEVVDYVLRRSGTAQKSVLSGPPGKLKDFGDEDDPLKTTEHDINREVATGARREDVKMAEMGKMDLGIARLISEKVFQAAFPLHDPSIDMLQLLMTGNDTLPTESESPKPNQINEMETNMRTMLTNQWCSFNKILKYQPLDYVRLYFGESVALYFAWLGLYTTWLIPVGIFGLIVFCMATIDLADDPEINDVCLSGGNFVMCPPCNVKGCKFWTLNSSCFSQKMTHLVDNGGTVLFAIFMALWATMFMEQWKRYQNVLAHRWNLQGLEPVDEPPRPEFLALLDRKGYKREINPITGHEEPVIPFWSRQVPVLFVTYASVVFGVVLCLAFLVGVIFYRLVINVMLLKSDNTFVSSTAGMITTVTSSCINLVCIFILKLIYDRVAVVMTNLENHRTQSQYDDSLTLKLYLLQFVNFYSSIFYIAFIQGTTAAVPGDTSVAIQSSGCDAGNCVFQLFIQLGIIMVGKQALNFVTENTLPPIKRFIKVYLARHQARKKLKMARIHDRAAGHGEGTSGDYGSMGNEVGWTKELTSVNKMEQRLIQSKSTMYHCRSNYTLIDAGSRPLFDEYLEMLIQYGFITMFVPAFPIAPLFALLNNMFELRTDGAKFLRILRRPVRKREKTIGVWFDILNVVSAIAIRTNACLIAFTTGFINRLTYMFYYSPETTLDGYVEFTLSYMDINRFNFTNNNAKILNGPYCRYHAFREPPTSKHAYDYTPIFWFMLAIKFAFVFVFENVALALTGLIAECIPDIPTRLSVISRHETRVVNDMILQGEIQEDEQHRAVSKPPTIQDPFVFFNFENPDINLKTCGDVGFSLIPK